MKSRGVVVGRGLGHRFGRGEEWIGHIRWMRQWTATLRPTPVGHKPAGDGHGHRHQSEQSGDDHRDYQAKLGQTNMLNIFDADGALLQILRCLGLTLFKRKDGVRLHHYLFA